MSRLPLAPFLAALVLGGFASTALAESQSAPSGDEQRVAVIERVSRSVVHVSAERKAPQRSRSVDAKRASKSERALEEALEKFVRKEPLQPEQGSGFVIDSARGLVLTAAHIVDDAGAITLHLPDGSTRPGEVVGIDEGGGIALLRMDAKLPALNLAPRPSRAGETAVVVGWMIPLKSIMPVEGMVMGNAPGVDGIALAPPFANYVAIDAVIPNGGFGGAPVIDRSGRVIGMVSAIYGRTYGPGTLTLMIPAQDFAKAIAELAATGRVVRGALGVTLDCANRSCAVTSVATGGAAEAAGVRRNDFIIAVDGVKMSSESQVRRAAAEKPVGSTVSLAIGRGGKLITLPLVTAAEK